MPTLVAITTSFRFAPRFNQFPIIVSDSPPRCPGTHREYASAVSMKLSPALIDASSTEKDAVSSAVHPNTLPPRHRGETRKLDLPRVRSCIETSGFEYQWYKRIDVKVAGACLGDRVYIGAPHSVFKKRLQFHIEISDVRV